MGLGGIMKRDIMVTNIKIMVGLIMIRGLMET